MSNEVHITTAENVIGATDAAIQRFDGADEQLVSKFLDIPIPSAKSAQLMAEQLGLVEKTATGTFKAVHPFASYLVTSGPEGRTAILRLILEQYQPYRTFKARLAITGLAAEAASQTIAIHEIEAHREDVQNTLVSLGSFTGSLRYEGGGLYQVTAGEAEEYLTIVVDVINQREAAELAVRVRMGIAAFDWVDRAEVLEPLVTAYQRAGLAEEDSRAPVLHSGNAVESFLVQVADHHGVNLQNAPGINAKVDALRLADAITKKHGHILKYLGHVRNAADHGTDPDPDIGKTWQVLPTTAIEHVHVAQSTIAAIVGHMRGEFLV